MAFKVGKAERKPTIACVGSLDLSAIGNLKHKEGSPYYSIPLQIKAQGKGQDVKVNLTFLPAFFAADFDPDTMEQQFGEKLAKGARYSYRSNFANSDATGMLQCICGDQENFERFGTMVDALPDLEPETIYDALVGFLQDLGPVGFGYNLKQGSRKTDQTDDDGKTIYEPTSFYDVDIFWRINDANVAKVVKRAAKNAEKRASDPSIDRFLVRFDAEMYSESAVAA